MQTLTYSVQRGSRQRWVLLAVLLTIAALILSACGAKIETQLGLESAEKGTRTMQVSFNMKDNKDKIPADLSSEVSGAVEQLKKALEGEDIEAIKSAQEKLSTTAQKIGEALYQHDQEAQQAQASSSGGASSEAPAEDDGIVDAEIIDDEDSK